MDTYPSLGRRAAAAVAAVKAGDSGLPTAWGGSNHSSTRSKLRASKSFRALRRLIVRSGIGPWRRGRLLAAVAACIVIPTLLLMCIHRDGAGGSVSLQSTAAIDKAGLESVPSALKQQQQQQQPLPKEQPKQQREEEQRDHGDDGPFPLVKRTSITAEQLLADPDLTMPVRLPKSGEVGSGKDGQRDVLLSMCDLDIAAYHRSPASLPKARLVFGQLCKGGGGWPLSGKTVSARELAEDGGAAGPQLQPSGFIFHQSRVGSTLVANMLASVPTNLVYSEPHLPSDVVHGCQRAGCSEEETVELLRMAILAMGRSQHHDEFFVKFQSSMGQHMDLVLKAFPDTPWIFIYRNPVEVLVSNLRTNGGACLRHKNNAPEAVQAILDKSSAAEAATVGKEEYCAAHVASLSDSALAHLQQAGSQGHAVSYESLVEELVDVVLPGHFGIALSRAERARMAATAEVYSKVRGPAEGEDAKFQGDWEEKQAAATDAARRAAETYLGERTRALEAFTAGRRGALAADARLRQEREAYVYERTGSRAFGLPSCPDEPEYPAQYRVVDMVRNWQPDDVRVPARHYASLCRFDYGKEADRAKAGRYMEAEVPFVLYNIPAVDAAVAKWNTPGYLEEKLGDKEFRVEVSKTNHFLYSSGSNKKDYEPPTSLEMWTYVQWRGRADDRLAAVAEAVEQGGGKVTPAEARSRQEHYYFRVSSESVVSEDMTVFRADRPALLRPEEPGNHGKGSWGAGGRGIHCRFGMEGVVAEAHYDGHMNWVAAVGGTRRWILAAPKECKHAYLRPVGDPSARHSEVDWTAPDLDEFPHFADMMGTEVLLTNGDMLFVPSFWVHYIASLGYTAQCNSRSGRNLRGLEDVQACGFHVGESKAQMAAY